MDMTYEQLVKNWQTQTIAMEEDLDTVLDNFRILFAFHSNAIENPKITYHDTREAFENGRVTGYTGDMRTLLAIQNQKECYEFLKRHILARTPLSSELILQIHEKLMHGCYDETRRKKGERPGQYKIHDYVTGDGIGSAPEDVARELAELCEEINGTASERHTTVASYLHLRFETIHPFADGNGRVGRTLLNYYLLTHGYPPTVLYEEDKQSYYRTLAIYDKTEDLSDFEVYLKEQTLKTWSRKARHSKPLEAFL